MKVAQFDCASKYLGCDPKRHRQREQPPAANFLDANGDARNHECKHQQHKSEVCHGLLQRVGQASEYVSFITELKYLPALDASSRPRYTSSGTSAYL